MSRLSFTVLLACVLVAFSVTAAVPDAFHRHSRVAFTPQVPSPPVHAAAPVHTGSVLYDGHNFTFSRGNDSKAVAHGTFKDGLNYTGWGELWISTSSAYPDAVQMFAAGYLEGVLTAHRILEMYEITAAQEKVTPAIQAFVDNQTRWVEESIRTAPASDSKWQGMSLIWSQYSGLRAGYNAHAPHGRALSRMDFDTLQLTGDWGDIELVVNREGRPDFSRMTPQQIVDWSRKRNHCSVLVKLTGDLSEIFASHSTWTSYASMNRIFKHYNLQLQSDFVAARRVSFSSYPGFLESLDDFYYLDSGLVMLETTNDVFNMALFDLVTPHSLFAWQRVRLASQNAHNGREWYEHVRWHNSGSYNNQYAILDFKLYKPGKPLVPDTLWVMEQIPGLVYGADQTSLLSFGYFPSFNVPFYPLIYNLSGYPAIQRQMGGVPGFDYQDAPRGQIFRRDAGKVENMTQFQAIMRYNDYRNDPISAGDPFAAICSRGDLAQGGGPFGCTDTKVISYSLFQSGTAYILNGPTTNGGALPAFSWSQFPTTVHSGQPERFDFDFVPTQW